MEHVSFTVDKVSEVNQELQNCKSVGLDVVHNFWLRELCNTHEKLTIMISKMISYPQKITLFPSQGNAYLTKIIKKTLKI